MKKSILAAIAVLAASNLFAATAPISTRHGKVLNIQQLIRLNGTTDSRATVATPTVHGTLSAKVITGDFAPAPLPAQDTEEFNRLAPPRPDFARYDQLLKAMDDCEADTQGTLSTGPNYTSNAAAENCGIDCVGPYQEYTKPPNATQIKNYVLFAVSEGLVRADGVTSVPIALSSMCTAINSAYPLPMRYIASLARSKTVNYRSGEEEMYDLILGHYLNTYEPRANIYNKPSSYALRRSVIDYLIKNNLESAWLDVEYQIMNGGVKKRISGSYTINRGDKIPDPATLTQGGTLDPSKLTVGQFIGARFTPDPEDPNSIGDYLYKNKIKVQYAAYGQYADLIAEPTRENLRFLEASMPTGFKNGLLSWQVTPAGSAINPDMCSGIASNAANSCNPTNGNGFVTIVKDYYDPEWPTDEQYSAVAGRSVRTIAQPGPDHDKGPNCLLTGKNMDGSACGIAKFNIPLLMRHTRSGTGELTYLGRWELVFEDVEVPKSRMQEMSRGAVLNVCGSIMFQNSVRMWYRVRRPMFNYNMRYNIEERRVDYTGTGGSWVVTDVALPRPIDYSTVWTGYNMLGQAPAGEMYQGNGSHPRVRDTSVPYQFVDGVPYRTNYEGVKLSNDPSGIPDPLGANQGILVMNPLIQQDVGPKSVYRPAPLTNAELDGASNWTRYMDASTYKAATLSASSTLPRGWRQDKTEPGTGALSKTGQFWCDEINEPTVMAWKARERSFYKMYGPFLHPSATPTTSLIPPTPNDLKPGSVAGYRRGFRPSESSILDWGNDHGEQCEVSGVPWTTWVYTPVHLAYTYCSKYEVLPPCDPASLPAGQSCPVPACIEKQDMYHDWYTITNTELERADMYWDACYETCVPGTAQRYCHRPY